METLWLTVSFKLAGYKFELEFDKIKKVMEVTVDGITVAAADANGIDDFEWYLTEVKRIMRLNYVGGFVISPKKLRKVAKLTDHIGDIMKNGTNLCAPLPNRFFCYGKVDEFKDCFASYIKAQPDTLTS